MKPIMSDINENLKKLDKWVLQHNPNKDSLLELDDLKKRALSENTDIRKAAHDEIGDRFYKELEFGTSGLRGIMGVGSNRVNVYTVIKATKGVAKYINQHFTSPSAAISYDSRINSELFAKTTAEVLIAHGIDVYLYDTLMPVPALSFAIRHHGCAAGVMITASHNHYTYNGYKVYDENGCQITDNIASKILENMKQTEFPEENVPKLAQKSAESTATEENVPKSAQKSAESTATEENVPKSAQKSAESTATEENVPKSAQKLAESTAKLIYMGEETKNAFYNSILEQKMVWETETEMQNDLESLSVVYTPLNGSGNIPVRKILTEIGVKNIEIVKEQELPDGNFPTCPYPNPEKKETLEKGLELLKRVDADLLVATDADADRVGAVVKTNNEPYLLNGNETGVLLFDFICSMKSMAGEMPKAPIAIRTLVSSKMFDAIAKTHNIDVMVTPTGFKYIGELVTKLETQGKINDFIFGFEESYGYLKGTYIRDKDAICATMLICQMVAYYKKQGKTLTDKLEELYEQHGYFMDRLISPTFAGEKGERDIAKIMDGFRKNPIREFAGKRVLKVIDYEKFGGAKSDSEKSDSEKPAGAESADEKPTGAESADEKPAGAKSDSEKPAGAKPTGAKSDSEKPAGAKSADEKLVMFAKKNVIEIIFEDDNSLVIRPSGTEPKLKIYLQTKGSSKKHASEELERMALAIISQIENFNSNSL